MERHEVLEELALSLEGAVDQMARAQRLTTAGKPGDFETLSPQLDRLFAEIVSLRNEVREVLMRELSKRPKKLPIV